MADHDEMLERVVATLKEPVHIDPTLDARVLAEIERQRVARSRGWRSVRWTIQLSPLGALAAAATFAGVIFAGSLLLRERISENAASAAAVAQTVQVHQFVLVAPTARRVALVGDFNDWNDSATLLTRKAGDGVWIVTVKLPPGRYRYAFVVDGGTWRNDPDASGSEDEFGRKSSVVTVGAGT